MTTEAQKVERPRFSPVAVGIALPSLFFIFRFTAAAALLAAALLYLFFQLHRSRRNIHVAFALFFVALLIPVDVYVPGFHGPLIHSKHSGLRLVQVLYGLGARPDENCEAISGGCVVSIHDTRWRLVWD